ncbi:MAG TPA: head GIN domain-containing protein [Casimicrobiaceae bacterium]|nr:head GIN domain-containing protein [Casimicrobiaceae bacterium]
MSRLVLTLLVLAAIAVSALLAWVVLHREGAIRAEEPIVATQQVQPFSAIEVSGAFDVVLVQGDQERIAVEGPVDDLVVRARVEGRTLRISARDTRRWWDWIVRGPSTSRSARITVTFRDLDSISLSGAVRLSADRMTAGALRIAASGGTSVRIRNLRADELRFSGSGALRADLSGQVPSQRISISGAGNYRADDLASDDVHVSVSGVGSVVVRAAKTLHASISGAGSVEYYGNPVVRQDISGMGHVKRREASASLVLPAPRHEGFRVM